MPPPARNRLFLKFNWTSAALLRSLVYMCESQYIVGMNCYFALFTTPVLHSIKHTAFLLPLSTIFRIELAYAHHLMCKWKRARDKTLLLWAEHGIDSFFVQELQQQLLCPENSALLLRLVVLYVRQLFHVISRCKNNTQFFAVTKPGTE